MNSGGEPSTDRIPALQQSPAPLPRSQGFVRFVHALIVVAIAVGASVIVDSSMEPARTPEAPSTTTYVITKEVLIPTHVTGAVQVGTSSASPSSSALPSMESSSVVPTSAVSTTMSTPSSTAALPSITTSSEPMVVTVEQVPVETTTVEPSAAQAVEQP